MPWVFGRKGCAEGAIMSEEHCSAQGLRLNAMTGVLASVEIRTGARAPGGAG
jgi:hypothetical protein